MKTLRQILENEQAANDVCSLFGTLFQSRDVAHLAHLNTNSYAAHMALGAYYDGIVGLLDGLIESYQGYFGICSISIPATNSTDNMLDYFKNLSEVVLQGRELFQKPDLQNTLDSISDLIASTIYKLEYLK